MVGILVSFWDGLFSGAMLVYWRVMIFNCHVLSTLNGSTFYCWSLCDLPGVHFFAPKKSKQTLDWFHPAVSLVASGGKMIGRCFFFGRWFNPSLYNQHISPTRSAVFESIWFSELPVWWDMWYVIVPWRVCMMFFTLKTSGIKVLVQQQKLPIAFRTQRCHRTELSRCGGTRNHLRAVPPWCWSLINRGVKGIAEIQLIQIYRLK